MSEALFVTNSIIEKYQKKYIWGTDKDAFLLLAELVSRRIHIDGFIGEPDEVGMVLFHIPVISLNMIEDTDTAIILSQKPIVPSPLIHISTANPFIHENFTAKHVVIYGAGCVGEGLLSILSSQRIKVDFFLDRDKAGQKLLDIPIYSPDKISELDRSTTVIIAGKYWEEMADILYRTNSAIQSFYVEKLPVDRIANNEMKFMIDDYTSLPLMNLSQLSECYPDKKIILLGNQLKLAKKYKEVLECLGYEKVSIMVTDENLVCKDTYLLDEVLYEKHYLLILYGNNSQKELIKKIYELNIADTDWTSIGMLEPVGHRGFMLDVNLGHTAETNFIPGIYLHGRENVTDVKIAILGGSTTEEERAHFRSWPNIMFEKYCRENITLYNGGISAYTSSQELIKLVRDVLYLKPDIIVVYDGYNDIIRNNSALDFKWLNNIMEYAQDAIYEKGIFFQRVKEGIFRGIDSNDVIRKWLFNTESMYGVAQVRNIRFHSFMQPMMLSQKIHTKHGMALYKMADAYLSDTLKNNMKAFRQRGRKIEESHPYIHDLSNIFDQKDVYMDQCHVWESGNEIIADEIWKVIAPDVKELLEQKGK